MRHAEERARIAEAKSAMLAANALKLETEASHKTSPAEVAALREENEAAAMLLGQVVTEINALDAAAAGLSLPEPASRGTILPRSDSAGQARRTSVNGAREPP